jgi:membrane protein YqaA with SNARE-associated domain
VRFLVRLKEYLLLFGIPGLFVISLLDSAAIPMVGGPDGVVILLSWQRPAQIPYFVLAAAAGSVIGCLILYRIGRAGGELAFARISPKKREAVRRYVEANGFLAVFLGVIAPPPFPTKPIILAAGIFRTPLISFLSAAVAGRVVRYAFMAYLGYRFGDQAAQVIRDHYPAILISMAGLAVLILIARRFLRKK